MKLIFLDIDGVLNHQRYYVNKFDKKRIKSKHDHDIDPISLKYLNRLTDETGAKIVLSSTWRMGRTLYIQDLFDEVGITGELWGATPVFRYGRVQGQPDLGSVERGKEIEYWLENKLGYQHISWDKQKHLESIADSKLEQYIILDDDTDMLYNQRNHFIHIPQYPVHSSGFDRKYYHKALKLLNKTIEEINY